jgi:hypothetical protein
MIGEQEPEEKYVFDETTSYKDAYLKKGSNYVTLGNAYE